MKTILKFTPVIFPALLVTACVSTPEPEVVEITPPPIEQTCYPIASLKKVIVPAVVKRGFSIVSIDSPPETYVDPETGKTVTIQNPPIETKTPYTKIVKPEEIYYTTQDDETVTDICELNKAEDVVNTVKEPALEMDAP